MQNVTVRFVLQEPRAVGQEAAEVTLRGEVGQSLLEVALAGGVEIEHTCGGVGGCSTCHVWIRSGMEHLSAPGDAEMDRVEQARDVRLYSRLACQAKLVHENATVVCEVPAWNRNAVREHG